MGRERRARVRSVFLGLIVLVGAGFAVVYFWRSPREQLDLSKPPIIPPEELARRVHDFCGACHAYPSPETFPRSAWKEEVERGYFFFGKSRLQVNPPPIDQVVQYFEERAPLALPTTSAEVATSPSPFRFEKIYLPGPDPKMAPAISNVSVVHLRDPKLPEILACDMRSGNILLANPREPTPAWKVLAKVDNPSHAEVVDLDKDGVLDILVADLGSFGPVDRVCGRVVWLRGKKDGTFEPITLLKNVGRVADVQAADFNGDGKLDLVVAVFGWQETGEILVLENRTSSWANPDFESHTIDTRHGGIHVPVIDLNGDGRPDFVAVLAQEHEEVCAYIHVKDFQFRRESIYKAPHPAYGSSGIQLVDMDGDHHVDVLLSNGDVLDTPHLLKPYHGVQWLRNPGQGKFPFEHRPIASLYGVHRAIAVDLRGQGKHDVFAVSYLPPEHFPQRKDLNIDAALLLEQVSPGKFARHSLARESCDYVTCAVGDLFGAGRKDLVLGHFTMATTAPAVEIWRSR